MKREKVIELMRASQIPVGKADCEWWELVDGVPTQLARLAALVEKETLERAARLSNDKNLITNYEISEAISNLKDDHGQD